MALSVSNSPHQDMGVPARLTIVTPPSDPLPVKYKILRYPDDGKGRASKLCGPKLLVKAPGYEKKSFEISGSYKIYTVSWSLIYIKYNMVLKEKTLNSRQFIFTMLFLSSLGKRCRSSFPLLTNTLCQVWLELVKWVYRSIWKCEKFTTTTAITMTTMMTKKMETVWSTKFT